MKLFIWADNIPYGANVVFVVARTLTEARKALASGSGGSYCGTNHWTHKQDDFKALSKSLGEPNRVIDVSTKPYGEWHEWSE